MPPPNVTAVLHAGHGLNNTIQDVLIRFERMRGRRALWVPGTDHAGIATQNVVEQLLAKEGNDPLRPRARGCSSTEVWDFVRETGGTILEQLKALGASCDWSRTYFTLDEDLSRAVREVFVRLYEKGLIYRGKYIINWCPRCLTALSNEEVEKEETDAQIWHLRYPLERWQRAPSPSRPRALRRCSATPASRCTRRTSATATWSAGRCALPLTDRLVPIVGDAAVDPSFGTGAVKVTPAHDPTDFEIGRRHDLPAHRHHDPRRAPQRRGAGTFRGLDRFEARKQVVAGVRGSSACWTGRAPPARGGPLLSLRHRGRAAALRPVVRADGTAGRTGAGGATATGG